MPRSTVGLLAALGDNPVCARWHFVHGGIDTRYCMLGAGAATGLAAYMALPAVKKMSPNRWDDNLSHLVPGL